MQGPASRHDHGGRESGAAVADFAMVSGLVAVLFAAVFQLGIALHVRNTLISCASEGARVGARAGADPADGVARTRQLISQSVSPRFAQAVTADVAVVDGVEVVAVHVTAPLPVLGPLGPDRTLDVVGHAFREDQ